LEKTIFSPPPTYQKTALPEEPVSQKGIALIVSLVVLLMMAIAMSALINRAGREMTRSNQWETSQDAFSAAETGLQEGQRWLKTQFANGVPVAKNLPVPVCATNATQGTDCCSNRLSLATAFTGSGSQTPLAHEETSPLQTLVGVKGKSGIMRYQFFVAPVDLSTGTRVGTGKGGSVGVGRGHQGGGLGSVSYYRIWACGFNANPAGQLTHESSLRALEITVSKNN